MSGKAGQPEEATGDRSVPADYGFSEWQPRLWHGMTLRPWLAMARGNWHRIALRRYPLAATILLTAAGNSAIAAINRLSWARAASRRELAEPPIFVLGFWRSGTTLLNELLVSDPRHVSPTTFQCMTPQTFALLSPLQWVLERILPDKRPMDAMDFSMRSPQEDEFAILNLGLKTPYRYMAFPSVGAGEAQRQAFWPQDEAEWEEWTGPWLQFLKCVAHANPGKRLVLKSPPHTGRVAHLVKLFPDAKFIHISRRPGPLFASNMKMNKAMAATQSLESHMQADKVMEDGIIDVHNDIYAAFFRDRQMIPAGNYCQVTYEALVEKPVETMAQIYAETGLGDQAAMLEAVGSIMADRAGYKAGSYQLEERLASRLGHEWRDYMEAFGYSEV